MVALDHCRDEATALVCGKGGEKMNLKLVAILCIISLMAIGLFAAIPLVQSNVLDDALTLAKAYLDRSYTELNSTHAVMKDLPGLPFTLHNVAEDKWLAPAKKTEAVTDNNDGIDWEYYGGCFIDMIDTGIDSDRLKLRYKWDTQWDSSYDGVVMYVELITLDNVNMKCYAKIESKADSDECDLYFDGEKVIDAITVDNIFERTQAYGWFTTRFVIRHGTKMGANMYENLGEMAKSDKLYNMWTDSGYTKDAYDGMWGESNSYPDYIGTYGDYPCPWSNNKAEVMPDYETWGNIPWFHYPDAEGVPYRSQLHLLSAIQMLFEAGNPLTPQNSWWMDGWMDI